MISYQRVCGVNEFVVGWRGDCCEETWTGGTSYKHGYAGSEKTVWYESNKLESCLEAKEKTCSW